MRPLLTAVLLSLLIAATPAHAADDDRLKVVATFSILADITKRIGGDAIALTSLTPVGAEVHEWELNARNFAALEEADVVLYNGYNLEQWMGQVRATVQDDTPLVPVAEESGRETLGIVTGDLEGDPDPHLWMDPRAAAAYGQAIADALGERAPEHAERFQSRADAFAEEMDALYDEIQTILAVIPDDHRTLITSEAAFLYFADAFDFHHDGIWGTNSEEEGTPRQVARVTDVILERQPQALFWESTISDRHVRSISGDTGVPYHGPLYVDSLSAADGDAPDYATMLRHNARMLADRLAP
ncbi:metal ABC transporter solute-binding protein, Zn/Mn family [Aquisalimonas asiatica]|uniref:Manganese/iron transport system substrate-binding protein n=1 Tax=Aquisalimonas asiatica TaxID=406100 RepID=A0A1H8V2Y3_9GAMM|nr:zinc ABC transporter substrate-binding protein [Aquisalimonas asiatica]SEP09594.1 manganese/iron transport system substrate-binding protein [Aquisalimonas asiatica]